MPYKHPESVLVVIYSVNTEQVLMLRRNDDPTFWQSVTGSLETDESPRDAAVREVKEETGIDIEASNLPLIAWAYPVEYTIFPQFLHRYLPGTTVNLEYQFYLKLPNCRSIVLTEHSQYQWLSIKEAAAMTKSWNNRDAILRLRTLSLLHSSDKSNS